MQSNSGNALFLILIAVALFAALSYAVTQSGRGGGGIERETAMLAASEVAQYASLVENAVTRMKLVNGCTDTQISFQSSQTGTAYENTNAPGNESCHVFSPSGGGVTWRAPDARLLDGAQSAEQAYGEYLFGGQTEVPGVGSDPACGAGHENGKELIMFLPYLKRDVCLDIARRTTGLASGAIPKDTNLSFDNRPGLVRRFQGVYWGDCGFGLSDTSGTFFRGKTTGCYEGDNLPGGGTYHFYHVLMAR